MYGTKEYFEKKIKPIIEKESNCREFLNQGLKVLDQVYEKSNEKLCKNHLHSISLVAKNMIHRHILQEKVDEFIAKILKLKYDDQEIKIEQLRCFYRFVQNYETTKLIEILDYVYRELELSTYHAVVLTSFDFLRIVIQLESFPKSEIQRFTDILTKFIFQEWKEDIEYEELLELFGQLLGLCIGKKSYTKFKEETENLDLKIDKKVYEKILNSKYRNDTIFYNLYHLNVLLNQDSLEIIKILVENKKLKILKKLIASKKNLDEKEIDYILNLNLKDQEYIKVVCALIRHMKNDFGFLKNYPKEARYYVLFTETQYYQFDENWIEFLLDKHNHESLLSIQKISEKYKNLEKFVNKFMSWIESFLNKDEYILDALETLNHWVHYSCNIDKIDSILFDILSEKIDFEELFEFQVIMNSMIIKFYLNTKNNFKKDRLLKLCDKELKKKQIFDENNLQDFESLKEYLIKN